MEAVYLGRIKEEIVRINNVKKLYKLGWAWLVDGKKLRTDGSAIRAHVSWAQHSSTADHQQLLAGPGFCKHVGTV